MKLRFKSSLRKNRPMLLTVLGFGIVGSLLLSLSHASTPHVSTEPENGTTANGAQSFNDNTASGGGAIRFGSSNAVYGSTLSPGATGSPTARTSADCYDTTSPNTVLTARLLSVNTISVSNGVVTPVTVSRCYYFYIPSTLGAATPSNKIPLVVVLHGAQDTGPGVAKGTNMDAEADSQHFIVAYPDGGVIITAPSSGPGPSATLGQYGWYSGVNKTASARLPQDYDFLYSLVSDMTNNSSINGGYTIDTKRAYLFGHSSGALMVNGVACAYDNPFAAMATSAGALTKIAPDLTFPSTQDIDDAAVNYSVRCTPSRPTSYLDIHGTSDTTVKYNGNVHLTDPSQGAYYDTAYNNVHLHWAGMDGCTGETTSDVTTTYASSATATQYDETGCQNGTDVRLISLAGITHGFWGAGVPIAKTKVDDIMWQFVSQYSLP